MKFPLIGLSFSIIALGSLLFFVSGNSSLAPIAESEIGFASYSPNGPSGGMLIPASCDSGFEHTPGECSVLPSISCSVSPTSANIGQLVTWFAEGAFGGKGGVGGAGAGSGLDGTLGQGGSGGSGNGCGRAGAGGGGGYYGGGGGSGTCVTGGAAGGGGGSSYSSGSGTTFTRGFKTGHGQIVISGPITMTFNYTGSQQQLVIPAGVTSIQADVQGAEGGLNNNPSGAGKGARVQTTLSVTQGETLYIYVGGAGTWVSAPGPATGGFNGGGNGGGNASDPSVSGGGASDIRRGTALSQRIVVAGGGGGREINGGGDGGDSNGYPGGYGELGVTEGGYGGKTPTYVWTGDAPLQGSNANGAIVSYSAPDAKTGSVTVTLFSQSTTQSCSNSVIVSQPSPPTASISADSTSISYNMATTIRWFSTNADSCTVSPPGWTGTSGAQSTGNLTSSQTYTVNCSGPGGSASDSVIVNVRPPEEPGDFSLNSPSAVCNAVSLSWTASSDATAYRILRGSPGVDISPYQPYTALNFTDTTVSQNTFYQYQIEAYNTAGTNRSNALNVNTSSCPPTLNFSGNPTSIFQGQSTTLTWSTTFSTSCSASGAWSGSKAVNGSETVFPLPPPSVTYTLACAGPGGGTGPQSVIINIAPLALPDWREIIPR